MDEFKKWVVGHKALAIGGGIALVVLLYLWLRSGSSANSGASSNSALSSYYAAEASSQQSAAAQVAAQDQLQAQENATNVQGQTYQAAIAAQSAPYQAQIDELTQLANLKAYQDYLGETNHAGSSTTGFVNTQNPAQEYVQQNGGPITDLSGNIYTGGGNLSSIGAVNWTKGTTFPGGSQVPGSIAPATPNTTPPVQPGQFQGFSAPTV